MTHFQKSPPRGAPKWPFSKTIFLMIFSFKNHFLGERPSVTCSLSVFFCWICDKNFLIYEDIYIWISLIYSLRGLDGADVIQISPEDHRYIFPLNKDSHLKKNQLSFDLILGRANQDLASTCLVGVFGDQRQSRYRDNRAKADLEKSRFSEFLCTDRLDLVHTNYVEWECCYTLCSNFN